MANNFKIHCASLTTTGEITLITATGSSIFIVSSIIISNIDTSIDSTVNLTITDTSQAADFLILRNETFLRTISKEVLSRPLIMENLDILKIQVTNANVFHVLVSYLDRYRE